MGKRTTTKLLIRVFLTEQRTPQLPLYTLFDRFDVLVLCTFVPWILEGVAALTLLESL